MISIEDLLCVKYSIRMFLSLILTKINCKLEIIITLSGVAGTLSDSKVLYSSTPQRDLLAPSLPSLSKLGVPIPVSAETPPCLCEAPFPARRDSQLGLSPLLCASMGLKRNLLAETDYSQYAMEIYFSGFFFLSGT